MISYLRSLFSKPVAQVLSAEQRFNSGSALSTSALSTFDQIVDDLIEANGHFSTVKDETYSEIDRVKAAAEAEVARLSELADAAMRQHLQNSAVIGNVRRLTGSAV